MYDQIIAGGIFIGLLGALVGTRWSPAALFGVAMLGCYLLGLVGTDEVLAKASNPGVVTLCVLLLVSQGLEKLDWVKGLAGRLICPNYALSLLRLYGFAALSSAVVNNTAVVATLASRVRGNGYHPASKLLLPLSYAAILGGTTTLIGTSTNLVLSSFVEDATGQGLAFFDFFIIGAAVSVLGFFCLWFAARFLPANDEADELNIAEYLVEAEVVHGSSLIGKSVEQNGLRDLRGLFLVEIVRGVRLIAPVTPQEVLQAGDKLIFSGDIGRLSALERFDGLKLFALSEGLLKGNLTEVIVMPGATLVGQSIKGAGFRALFDAAVVGLRRGGSPLSGKLGDIVLQPGDSLILATGPDFYTRKNLHKNFAVLGQQSGSRISRLENVFISFGLLAAIALASAGVVSLLKGLAVILAGMLALGTLRGSELRRRFPFDLILIVVSALVLAQALANTGLADLLSGVLAAYLPGINPHLAIAGLFLATWALTELMTNTAAAAMIFPVAFGLAQGFGLDPMPFVMAVAYGASASFLTPYGYTTNLLVQNLGGYRLRDYVRFGLLLTLVYAATVIFLIPMVFPFLVG
ncbi:MAG: SLC13 family permease [Cellvibrionales bacterium]|nr:SLC13 family permease [Cellvibrionales bacterium]